MLAPASAARYHPADMPAKSSRNAEQTKIARLQADVARLYAALAAMQAAETNSATLTDGRVR
jgi:hypothetical protein